MGYDGAVAFKKNKHIGLRVYTAKMDNKSFLNVGRFMMEIKARFTYGSFQNGNHKYEAESENRKA